MKRLLTRLNKNLLLKVAGYNSIHVGIRIAIGVVMSKIIALYVGAAGMAVMGNLRDFTQGVWRFAVLGLDNGLVKNAAELKASRAKLKQTFNTAWCLSLIASILIGIFCFIYADWLDATLIASDVSYNGVFKILGISLPFHAVFIILSSLMQGNEWYRKFITLNICISIVLFAVSAYLIYQYNLMGALYGMVVVPFIQALLAIGFWLKSVSQESLRLSQIFNIDFDPIVAKPLLKYSVMALASAIMLPAAYIFIRKQVMLEVSDTAAGWWEAVSRVSNYYMMFVTSLISLYVLPSLSKDASIKNYRSTIVHFYKNILPIVILGLISIFLCKDLIIQLLFTQEFTGAVPLFKWQLAGDFIKIITTVMAFRFIAQNQLKKYLIAEIASVGFFVVISYFLIPVYQEEGVVIAYFLNYVFYILVLISLLRKELFSKIPTE